MQVNIDGNNYYWAVEAVLLAIPRLMLVKSQVLVALVEVVVVVVILVFMELVVVVH